MFFGVKESEVGMSFLHQLCIFCSLFCLPLEVWAGPAVIPGRSVFGWVEKAQLLPDGIAVHAKLDTGAEASSLNAENLSEFISAAGERRVRFLVRTPEGEKRWIERPVLGMARIKGRSRAAAYRPVVRIGICLGQVYLESEVNLTDRSEFDYEMLIGRSFLAGHVVVDPSSMFTEEPACSKQGL